MRAETAAERDRSLVALAEIGLAALLIGAFFVPWFRVVPIPTSMSPASGYVQWEPWNGISGAGITMPNLLALFFVPLGTIAAVAAAVAGLALPGRGEVRAILVTFAAASLGALMEWVDLAYGDHGELPGPPGAAAGLWLFTAAAFLGVGLALVDLAWAGSSTIVWRALGRPSTRRFGLALGYVGVLAITLPVFLFPMFPRWWLIGWLAILMAPLLVLGLRRIVR